jgi:hypothetical protein
LLSADGNYGWNMEATQGKSFYYKSKENRHLATLTMDSPTWAKRSLQRKCATNPFRLRAQH